MARTDHKARYIGTWREDLVTDNVMRQILARSHAEKGEKVKVKLSKDGLSVVQTVLFQESALTSFPLRDMYFMTVNQNHPTCLLAIASDPVRKYVIVALKTSTETEAQEIANTFQSLKENPSINSGNVELRRQDNGRWTLRERSRHNADRQLQNMDPDGVYNVAQPAVPRTVESRARGGGERARMQKEVDRLSQELRDMKHMVERSGSINSRTSKPSLHYNNNNNNISSNNNHVTAEVHAMGGVPHANGGLVSAHRPSGLYLDTPGEARVVVEDYRGTSSGGSGVVSATSNYTTTNPQPETLLSNGKFRRQITVPPAAAIRERAEEEVAADDGATPIIITSPTTDADVARLTDGRQNGYVDVEDYAVHRREVSGRASLSSSRRESGAESMRSGQYRVVSFGDPEAVRRNLERQRQFWTARRSKSGVPTTVVRPIEETYGRGTLRAATPQAQARPSILKSHRASYGQMYTSPDGTVYVDTPQPAATHPAAYLPRQELRSSQHQHQHQGHAAPDQPAFGRPVRRSSRPNSIHVMEGNELRVYRKSGGAQDVPF